MNPLTELSLIQLQERTSMKWRTHPADVLPLWVAEMDVPLAPPIKRALDRALSRGDTGYAYGGEYAQAVSDFASERWGWNGLGVERTALVPDVMMGIVEVLRLISSVDDTVVVAAPVYAPFYAFVVHSGRRVLEAALSSDGRLDAATLEDAFEKARQRCDRPVFLLCNPHNPTGTVHRRAELEMVARLAGQYGVRVVSDEIHAPVVLAGAQFVPYLSIEGSDDAFALLSATKGWNLAGLKAALLVAGPAARSDLEKLPEEVSHGPSHLGVIAHSAAFAEGGAWLDDLLRGLEVNRELLTALVEEHLPGAVLRRPEGTYLAWLDCSALELESGGVSRGIDPAVVTELAGPARFFLERARVALSSGHVFGSGGEGRLRVNFATRPDLLTLAFERMGHALRHR